MEEYSYRLIVEYFEKTIDDRGLTRLQDWIEESPDNLEQFIETIQILEAAKAYAKPAEEGERVWQQIAAHIGGAEKTKKKLYQRLHWLTYAAACLIICASCLIAYHYYVTDGKTETQFAEISNPNGQHSRILLPDSSVVYLAGGSTIKYAKKFAGSRRAVYLRGEAFFEVMHRPKRPFVVQSGEISTVVLGTSFNVKAFELEDRVVITVKTGKVGVMASVKGKNQLIKYLTPNEEIEINTRTDLYTFNTTDADAVIGWINNDFVFYNTPLHEITASLERRYGVKIEFTDPELGRSRLTVRFKNMPVNQVMEDLSTISGLAFTQKQDHIFITNHYQKGGKIMK